MCFSVYLIQKQSWAFGMNFVDCWQQIWARKDDRHPLIGMESDEEMERKDS
jgi:hypothetical protein